MSDSNLTSLERDTAQIFPFPASGFKGFFVNDKDEIPTPVSDALEEEGEKLNRVSKFKSEFDYEAFRRIERRYHSDPVRGGIVMKTAFRLVNSHSTCQQCLYAFEIDTYGRGCIHDCVYCYAKAELTVHGYWNNPIPVPVDINQIRKAFYTTFETDKKHKFREILEQRIPLRIGSMSDSFMWSDRTYKVTQELLKILKFYNYPYVIFTRSDLVATDEYLKLLDKDLCSVQFSMSSVDDKLTKLIEPGAPSPTRRIKALSKLSAAGFWTTVRINPLFPNFQDGYFTDPDFNKAQMPKELKVSTLEMIDHIADAGVPSVLVGFGRFSRSAMNSLSKALEVNMKDYFRRDLVEKSPRDFHFTDREISHYYRLYKRKCDERGVQFTTCYIGNGEGHFWKDQGIWSNKKDCCNIKGRVAAFTGADSRQVPFENRLKYTNHKCATPTSDRLHEPLGEVKAELSRSRPPEMTL